jgi:hypothetical protein
MPGSAAGPFSAGCSTPRWLAFYFYRYLYPSAVSFLLALRYIKKERRRYA